jgi:hypothetical protein
MESPDDVEKQGERANAMLAILTRAQVHDFPGRNRCEKAQQSGRRFLAIKGQYFLE